MITEKSLDGEALRISVTENSSFIFITAIINVIITIIITDIIGFETAPNVSILSRSWNKRTQGWLERYTYHRTNRDLGATYFVSALWHGLYPVRFIIIYSYILGFIHLLIRPFIHACMHSYIRASSCSSCLSRL